MFLLVLLGNPAPEMMVNELSVAPDTSEGIEITGVFGPYDLSGWTVMTDLCTTAVKQGVIMDGCDQPFFINSELLEGELHLGDTAGFFKLVDTAGAIWIDFEYYPGNESCEYGTVAPPWGWSASHFDNGISWYFYRDSTPTPGEPNDDLDTNRIYGVVRDGETGDPILGAEVFVYLTDYCCAYYWVYPRDYYDTTDASGFFSMDICPTKTNVALIWAEASGYAYSDTDSIEIVCNFVHIEHNIYLYPAGVTERSGDPASFLTVFPNPSPGILKLVWSPGPDPVAIYDVLGRSVKSLPGDLGEATISLEPGVYLVKRGNKTVRAILKSGASSVY